MKQILTVGWGEKLRKKADHFEKGLKLDIKISCRHFIWRVILYQYNIVQETR